MNKACQLRTSSIETDTFQPCTVEGCDVRARKVDDVVTVGVGSCAVNIADFAQQTPECTTPSCSDERPSCGDEMAIAMGCPKKPVQQF